MPNCAVWSGELINVYANSIRRMTWMAGFIRRGHWKDCENGFINGFPNHISTVLQHLHIMEMGELITYIWVLARQKEHMHGTAAVVGRSSRQSQVAKERGLKRQNLKMQYFQYQAPHMVKDEAWYYLLPFWSSGPHNKVLSSGKQVKESYSADGYPLYPIKVPMVV